MSNALRPDAQSLVLRAADSHDVIRPQSHHHGGIDVKPYASGIVLGVSDVGRSKAFYAEGLGWPIDQEVPGWIRFLINSGACAFGMKSTEALANDAGVPADRSGFEGVSSSYDCGSNQRVDGVMDEAENTGGTVVKPAVVGRP
jgi:uncharacterized protein